jgi:MFS family permease
MQAHGGTSETSERPTLRQLLSRSLWSDAGLFSVSQAGLVNNLNDGAAWGLFPLLFAMSGLTTREIGMLAAVYPAAWSTAQIATGALSDRWGRKWLIVGGMLVQGAALFAIAFANEFATWAIALVVLGLGTAMVYPALLAAVGDLAHPSWRGTAVGVYRLWRDLGYAAGALLAGTLADLLGLSTSIAIVGVLTVLSGVMVAVRLRDRAKPSSQIAGIQPNPVPSTSGTP